MKRLLFLFLSLVFSVAAPAQLANNNALVGSGTDAIAPRISTITVNNTTPNVLTIQLIDASFINTQVPVNNRWTISGVASLPIVTSQIVDGINRTIELTLNSNVIDDDVPLVTYSNPGDGTGIKDIKNNFLASFSNHAVVNNTGVLPVFAGNPAQQWLLTSTGFTAPDIVEDRSGNNFDGKLVESHCLTSNGTLVFTFSSLTGVTITSWEGTSTLAIVGNTITTTSGTVYNILLSNGTRLPCAEGSGSIAYDAVNSLNGTLSGTVDWTGLQDTFHWNILNGFSFLGRMDAINQYVALTSNINPGTGKISLKIIYAPDNIATTQDLLGTATTANRLEIATSAGAMGGTLRMGSGTTYTLSSASNAATIGWANNTFATIILTRDALGNVTLTINGFPMLIDGAASVVDASSTAYSQLMRTSTSNSNIGILKEVEILDHSTASEIGKKYNAGNSFNGTLTGGFTLRRYPKPQGGDASHRNPSSTWHNVAETKIKPNPTGSYTSLQTATGWTSSTKLSYADLVAPVSDPSFDNITNRLKIRNLVTWTTALPYVDEKRANAFVGKTTIPINNITGFNSGNRLSYAAGSSYNATGSMTVKVVLKPIPITASMVIFGKTAAVDGNGWAVQATANASGSDITLRVRDGSNALKKSRNVTFSEKEDDISIYHFVIRGGFMYSYRNGCKENTSVAISGITTSTDDLVIGALSGGSAYTGGVVAAAFYENIGMTDAEVEASYQATKNNAYVQEDGITLLYVGESGNANWPNQVTGSGGSPTLIKSGTLTVTSFTEAFNYRFRPEDYADDATPQSPPLANTSTALRIMVVGDSRYDAGGGFSLAFAEELYTLVKADPDIGNAEFCGFFTQTLTGVPGTPTFRHHAINGSTSSSMRSGGGGNIGVHTALAYPDGSPTICLVLMGTNATGSETNFNTEVDEYPILLQIIRSNSPAGLRFAVMEELEHEDANRRARLQDLSYQHREVIWKKMIETGYLLSRVQQYRTITIQNGDFSDVVHQNTQGNIKKAQRALRAIKLAAGYNP